MCGSHGMHSITTFAMEPGEIAQQRVHTAFAGTGAPTLQPPVIPGPRRFYISGL